MQRWATVPRSITLAVLVLVMMTACARVDQTGIINLVPSIRPKVVLIKAFDRTGAERSQASGVAVAATRVITAAHVLIGAFSLQVITSDSQSMNVLGVVAVDFEADAAVLEVSGKLPPAKLGSSEKTKVGEGVVAIGNPSGLEGTVSEGIISAVRSEGGHEVFQTTAPISPGSSGGGLFDTRGLLIGITVAQIRDGQNLNFAIPIHRIQALIVADGPLHSVGMGKQWTKSDLEQEMLVGQVREVKTEYARVLWNGRAWVEEPRQLVMVSRYNRFGFISENDYFGDRSTVDTYMYDAQGVLKSIVGASDPQTVTYDDAARQTTMQQGSRKIIKIYDAVGNVIEERGGFLGHQHHRYDNKGRLIESIYLGSKGEVTRRVRNEYDAQGMSASSISYDPKIQWNIEYTDYVWDAHGNWIARRESDGETSTIWYRTILYY